MCCLGNAGETSQRTTSFLLWIFFSILPPRVSGPLSPASDLGEIHPGEPTPPASMPWVLEELGPKARALAEDLEIGVSMVSGGRTYVRVCVQVWVCVHGLLSLGSFAWEMEVVDGGRDVKFSATQ